MSTGWQTRRFTSFFAASVSATAPRNGVHDMMRPYNRKRYDRRVSGKEGAQEHTKFVTVKLDEGEILMPCSDITKNFEAERMMRERRGA